MNQPLDRPADDACPQPVDPPLFPLGQVVATPGALAVMQALGISPWTLVRRHQRLDPGELGLADQQANRDDLAAGERIFSKYAVGNGQSVYVITERDRSVTTLLLPEEY